MAIAISLHYFLLTAFTWSFIAGYQIYILLVVIFDSASEKSTRMSKYKVLGYGAPAVTIILTYAIDRYVYQGSTYDYQSQSSTDHLGCWMSPNELFIIMFFIPVVLMLTTNMGMLCK